ncbi:hypothetical protein R1flu_021865 [Riccia fluitans]|uniref:Uncharacterized protein n=1 Tax=Riccia fluitans TaxID=41844 RepID=A0ABD1ZRR5_9MARC
MSDPISLLEPSSLFFPYKPCLDASSTDGRVTMHLRSVLVYLLPALPSAFLTSVHILRRSVSALLETWLPPAASSSQFRTCEA